MPEPLRRENGVLSIDRKKDGPEHPGLGDRGSFGGRRVFSLFLDMKGGSYGKRLDTRD